MLTKEASLLRMDRFFTSFRMTKKEIRDDNSVHLVKSKERFFGPIDFWDINELIVNNIIYYYLNLSHLQHKAHPFPRLRLSGR
mgnify:CR=1 FL=1